MPRPPRKAIAHSPQRRELYFFTLYRMLEAALLALVAFSPAGEMMLEIREPVVLQSIVELYVLAATALLHSVTVLATRDGLRAWTIMLAVRVEKALPDDDR